MSTVLETQGKYAEAHLAAQRARETDAFLRDASTIVYRLFNTSFELEQADDARHWCMLGRAEFPADWLFRHCQVLLAAHETRSRADIAPAWRTTEELLTVAPAGWTHALQPQVHLLMAAAIARAGLPDSALRVIRRTRTAAANDPQLDYYESLARLALGQQDSALALIHAYLRNEPNDRRYVGNSVWFKPLRGTPRFDSLTTP